MTYAQSFPYKIYGILPLYNMYIVDSIARVHVDTVETSYLLCIESNLSSRHPWISGNRDITVIAIHNVGITVIRLQRKELCIV